MKRSDCSTKWQPSKAGNLRRFSPIQTTRRWRDAPIQRHIGRTLHPPVARSYSGDDFEFASACGCRVREMLPSVFHPFYVQQANKGASPLGLFPEGLLSSPLARISRIECRDNNKPPTARASGHGGGHTISGTVRPVPPAAEPPALHKPPPIPPPPLPHPNLTPH